MEQTLTSPEQQAKQARLLDEFPGISTEAWEAVIQKDLKGADYAKRLLTKTYERITMKPYYRQEDMAPLGSVIQSLPGQFPYLRGYHKTAGWSIRQDFNIAGIAEANRLARQALERGASDIGFVSRFDADGVSGVPVQTQAQMNDLLSGIFIELAPVHFNWGCQSPLALAMLANVVAERKLSAADIKGSLAFDPLGNWAVSGGGCDVSEKAAKLAEIVRFSAQALPGYRVITVSGQPYHNAGASAVEELAAVLSATVQYLDILTEQGLKPEEILSRLTVELTVSSKMLMEVAKLRAFRVLWANLLRQYGVSDACITQVPVHCVTSPVNKTLYDPNVNMLRSTIEAMAAVVGGCNSLTVDPFDARLGESTEIAYRVARNVQLILKEEVHLEHVVDPAGGSYAIENLTHELTEKAWALFLEWEKSGGFIQAIQNNVIQSCIQTIKNERMQYLAQRRDILLGTTQYPNLAEQMLPEIRPAKKTALNGKTDAALLSKPIGQWQEALKNGASVAGWLNADTIAPASEREPLTPFYWAEVFESMRLQTEKWAQKTGRRPEIFLLTIGNPAMRTARASFMANFFGCAGYEILNNNGFASVADAMIAVSEKSPDVVVLCSSDAEYETLGPEVAEALKKTAPNAIRVIAGNPVDHIEALKKAGFDEFIHVRTNLVDCLTHYQQKLGVC